jgi:hypothetical protein
MAAHSLSAVQARQVFVALLQIGVAPEHVESSVHWTHAPVAAHAGCVASTAVHWDALVHPAQVLVAVLQIGVAPEQLALVRHCTHLFVAVSHLGVAPEQVELSVHWTQAPVGAHTGFVGSMPAHCADVVQAVHTPLAAQTGVAAGHVAPVIHCTQAPLVQMGAPAGQSVFPTHCGTATSGAKVSEMSMALVPSTA